MKRSTYLATLAAISTALAVGAAYAGVPENNDALSISNAKIGLAQAVSTAEQHVGGKASHADYERDHGKWVFDVEVVKQQSVVDVTIDPIDGKVITVRADQADREDSGDHED